MSHSPAGSPGQERSVPDVLGMAEVIQEALLHLVSNVPMYCVDTNTTVLSMLLEAG